MYRYSDKCTIMICSCDAYEDAWYPFFELFKKYWPDCPYRLILNTESKAYNDPKLSVESFAFFNDRPVPYGERMIRHLKEIHTPYTLVMMDDFFLRRPVDGEFLEKVMSYLDNDERAVVFSFQNVVDELNTHSQNYPGFDLRPLYGYYKFNFQAAIWKTEYLLGAWKPHESPWAWEGIGNYRSFDKKHDFYVLRHEESTPLFYGFDGIGHMGIYRGKWYTPDVVPLFEKHNLQIDLSKRGCIDHKIVPLQNEKQLSVNQRLRNEVEGLLSFGIALEIKNLLFRLKRKLAISDAKGCANYIEYMRRKM